MMNIPAKMFLCAFLVSTGLSFPVSAELKMASIFGDHMVLQRDEEVRVWGWSEPGAEVTVEIAGQKAAGSAAEDGRWEVRLAPLETNAAGLEMTVASGDQSLTFSDVLVGEVWLCSGQSNMQWPVAAAYDPDLEAMTADYPGIRLITVPQVGTQEPQIDFKGQWEVCTPESVAQFSAVGYFFGRQLHRTLGVPVGLIDNAWGGSAAEAWVKRDVLEADPAYADYIAEWEKIEETFDYEKALAAWEEKARQAREAGRRPPRRPRNELAGQHRPGNLYAGVLHPLIGYSLRGVIWYQGESNSRRAWNYRDLFPLMIRHWREEWDQGDFPFYWVQLADFREETEGMPPSDWAVLREAQTHTLALPNTGQAVIYDIGEGRDIHPRNKQDVAKRLARIALARDYGYDELVHLSPSFDAMEVQGDKAILTFKNVGKSGLYTFDVTEAKGFHIAGQDREWHRAEGEVVGENKVRVWSDEEEAPVAVRYAWADNPVANLGNREGLPVVPFRTDDWPVATQEE